MDINHLSDIMEKELSQESLASFQEFYKKRAQKYAIPLDEFESLKIVRRFFMSHFKSPADSSFLEKGLTVFKILLQQDPTNANYILIHSAYFYEYLGKKEEADGCVRKALSSCAGINEEVVIEKVGKFYCHFAEKGFINPIERAVAVFTAFLSGSPNYKNTLEQQIERIKANEFYTGFKELTGDTANQLTGKIIYDPNILSQLKDFLSEMKSLVEASYIRASASFLDQVVRTAIKKAGNEFRKTNNLELSRSCSLLDIMCSSIFIASKGLNDISNFTNFADVVDILDAAKRQALDTRDDAKEYYNNYDDYIEKAIELGEKAITDVNFRDKDAPRFYSSLANVYRLRGNVRAKKNKEQASDDYRRAVELFRKLGSIIYEKNYLDWDVERLAECYFHLGEYESAILEYSILKEQAKTKRFQAALRLGDVYDAIGDFQNAKACFLECLKSPDNIAAFDKLVHLHRSYGDYDAAVEWQRKMISLVSSKEALDYQYFILATLYEEKGDGGKAIDTFKYIVTERQLDSLISLDHLINLLISNGDYQEAIHWLKKKMNISTTGSFGRDHCLLGDCYLNLHEYHEAFEHYTKVLTVEPTNFFALQRLAKWHELKGEYKKAIDITEKIIKILGNEKSDGLYKWMGDLYWKLKDNAHAINCFYESLRIKPRQPEIYERLEKITQNKPDQSLVERIESLERRYREASSPELATQIVNLSLTCRDKQYAMKAQGFLSSSIYTEGTFDYHDKLALIFEKQENYDAAINERKKIDVLESVEPELKLRNIKATLELLKENRLSQYKVIELKYIKKMIAIVDRAFPSFDENQPFAAGEESEETGKTISIFQEYLNFLARHHLEKGSYALAHKYIGRLLTSTHSEIRNDRVYLLTEAEIYFEEGNLAKAEEVAKKILCRERDDTYAFLLLGKIYRHKREFRKAVKNLQQASTHSRGAKQPLDQLAATYREWAKEPTLTELEKKEKKDKAIEIYSNLRKRYPNDEIISYGLAKSYLLEPLSSTDIDEAVKELTALLKGNKIDRRAMKELLYLWTNHNENTIQQIISGRHELTQNRHSSQHQFLLATIESAKTEDIFSENIVRAFQNIFAANPDNDIRKAICRYMMKYVVYKYYQATDRQEVLCLARHVVELILTHPSEEAMAYLSEFLGAERGSYLEFLSKKIYPDIKDIQDAVWLLSEANLTEVACSLTKKIKILKKKLETIESVSFSEDVVSIKERIEWKSSFYQDRRTGGNTELSVTMKGIEGINVQASAWEKVDKFIFDSLDIGANYDLSGSFEIVAEHKNRNITVCILYRFSEMPENGQADIKKAFANLHTNNLATAFTQLPSGFVGWVVFKPIIEETVSSPFKQLADFLIGTYGLPLSSDYWVNVYTIAKREVRLDSENCLNDIVNHIAFQISTLSSKAKSFIDMFLEVPHDLKNLLLSDLALSEEERKTIIHKVKSRFKNLSFLTRDFLYPDESQNEFDLKNVAARMIQEFTLIPLRKNLPVKISFHAGRKEDSLLFSGSPEHIEAIFRNLFYNAFDAINKKIDSSPHDIKPDIQISLCRKDRNYEILFSDNGIGLPTGTTVNDMLIKKEQKSTTSGDTTEKSGTSVGLNIISTLVSRYKGRFDVLQSETGKNSGVKFIIGLPIEAVGRDEI